MVLVLWREDSKDQLQIDHVEPWEKIKRGLQQELKRSKDITTWIIKCWLVLLAMHQSKTHLYCCGFGKSFTGASSYLLDGGIYMELTPWDLQIIRHYERFLGQPDE